MKCLLYRAMIFVVVVSGPTNAQTSGVQLTDRLYAITRRGTAEEIHNSAKVLMSAGSFSDTTGGVVQEFAATARCKISSMTMRRTRDGDKRMIIQNADASEFGGRVTTPPSEIDTASEIRFFTRDSSELVRKLDKLVRDTSIVSLSQTRELFLAVVPPRGAEAHRRFIDAFQSFSRACEPIW